MYAFCVNAQLRTAPAFRGIIASGHTTIRRHPWRAAIHQTKSQEVHWGYEGDSCPEHWGQPSPGFAVCALGAQQSTIDISGAEPRPMAPVAFEYGPTPPLVLNNGRTLWREAL